MIKKKYILRDAVNHRELHKYAQKVIRLIKDAELNLLQNQLNIIYNDIDFSLRKKDVKRSKIEAEVTLNNMMKNLNEIKHDWWNYDSKTLRNLALRSNSINLFINKSTNRRDERASSFDQYDANRFLIKSQRFNSYRSFSNNLNYQSRYSNYVYNNQYSQQRFYQSYQSDYQQSQQDQDQQNQYSNVDVLSVSQFRLQITIESIQSNESSSQINSTPHQSFQLKSNQSYRFDYNNYNNDRDDYQFKLQRVYQASVENDNDVI